jgi:hypothetical protein
MFLQELFVIESTKIPYPEQKEHTPDMDDSVVVQPANPLIQTARMFTYDSRTPAVTTYAALIRYKRWPDLIIAIKINVYQKPSS